MFVGIHVAFKHVCHFGLGRSLVSPFPSQTIRKSNLSHFPQLRSFQWRRSRMSNGVNSLAGLRYTYFMRICFLVDNWVVVVHFANNYIFCGCILVRDLYLRTYDAYLLIRGFIYSKILQYWTWLVLRRNFIPVENSS